MNRTYYQPKEYRKNEILEILQGNNREELVELGLAVGLNCPDWKFAQEICLKLANNEDMLVRANAILGLAHIARTKGRLEKRLVKPIILRELRLNENRSKICDSIEDINLFLGWKIGLKSTQKLNDRSRNK